MSKAKTILIVEDEVALLNVLCTKLASEGFTVLAAQNGQDGLQIALAAHPDLILLDIVLPVMDGLTVLKELHADKWGKRAKIIMLTNLGDIQSVVDTLVFGSHDFLVKSDWKIEDVVKTVRDRLKG